MQAYISIAGGYAYPPLRVGMIIRNPLGREVYIQPGDDESIMRDNIEALEEIPEDKLEIITDMVLSEYFS